MNRFFRSRIDAYDDRIGLCDNLNRFSVKNLNLYLDAKLNAHTRCSSRHRASKYTIYTIPILGTSSTCTFTINEEYKRESVNAMGHNRSVEIVLVLLQAHQYHHDALGLHQMP
ncbi:hypothetical protein PIB30_056545 [Stylosanthes scabra]|uniref:Uncharacterized protein n=1 Tax=Stylosanthes scabra TaxID=79078 RepID=A0ABU6VHV7_9FABA|nr:hypothetical protein [Stylosanthes scabra]